MKVEDIKVGLVVKEGEYEGVVIHNRKLPGDICILWNISNDLYKSLYSYDVEYIVDMVNNGDWKVTE